MNLHQIEIGHIGPRKFRYAFLKNPETGEYLYRIKSGAFEVGSRYTEPVERFARQIMCSVRYEPRNNMPGGWCEFRVELTPIPAPFIPEPQHNYQQEFQMQSIPKVMTYDNPPVTPYPGRAFTEAEKVEHARKALADAEAALALKEARDARAEELRQHMRLCNATSALINEIARAEQFDVAFAAHPTYVEFLDELKPIADDYGYKIVKVGDKKSAMLVQK